MKTKQLGVKETIGRDKIRNGKIKEQKIANDGGTITTMVWLFEIMRKDQYNVMEDLLQDRDTD